MIGANGMMRNYFHIWRNKWRGFEISSNVPGVYGSLKSSCYLPHTIILNALVGRTHPHTSRLHSHTQAHTYTTHATHAHAARTRARARTNTTNTRILMKEEQHDDNYNNVCLIVSSRIRIRSTLLSEPSTILALTELRGKWKDYSSIIRTGPTCHWEWIQHSSAEKVESKYHRFIKCYFMSFITHCSNRHIDTDNGGRMARYHIKILGPRK